MRDPREEEDTAAEPDIVSDPAHDDEAGSDWTDEGGASPQGPATWTEHADDSQDQRKHTTQGAGGAAQKRDRHHPTQTAPDSVSTSVPSAAEHAGKRGPNAADPPRAKGKGPGRTD